jgi:hypothetical protein
MSGTKGNVRLAGVSYGALKTEVVRACSGMTSDQISDLADSLQAILRLRRPRRAMAEGDGWLGVSPGAALD